MTDKQIFVIAFLSFCFAGGCIDAALHYRPTRDGYKPGLLAIIFYMFVGAAGAEILKQFTHKE